MEALLNALRAAAEPTRLRLLNLCGHAELTVTELTQILGQSQPRVSRHLKLLCDAGLVNRLREGSWAFFRLASDGMPAELARQLLDQMPDTDQTLARDLERLDQVRRARAESAAAYFRANAADWDKIRSLYVDDSEVERALVGLTTGRSIDTFVDVGTGTGRLLAVLGPQARVATGLDLSREMLAIARNNIDTQELRHCSVRHGDMYQLPFGNGDADLVTIHQVLHYAEDPAEAIAEAGRVLRPGGRMIIVDFAPHAIESLRDEHAHRRLGFSDAEVERWVNEAGLELTETRHLEGDPLTVCLWAADRPGAAAPQVAAKLGDADPRNIQ